MMDGHSQDIGLSDLSEGEVSRLIEGHGMQGHLPGIGLYTEPEPVTQTGTHVDTQPFCGDYNFRVSIRDTESRNSYTYSSKLNRVYTDLNKAVPINFHWTGPTMLYVRAMMVYTEPDSEKNAVIRCLLHSDPGNATNNGFHYVKHIMRCDNINSTYVEDEVSGRHSVITSLNDVPHGADYVAHNYRFMCNTSCTGGPNRRKTDIIFTLEDFNCHVLGRAVVGVKICSCPRRDKGKDEVPSAGKKRRSTNSPLVPVRVDQPLRQHAPRIKEELATDDSEVAHFKVRVPKRRSEEFKTMISRWLYEDKVPQAVCDEAAAGCIMEL